MITRPKERRRLTQKAQETKELNEERNKNKVIKNIINNVSEVDPTNYTAAMKTATAEKWKIAIKDEIQALRNNGTWVAVPRPSGVQVLHSKWVFKTKFDANGGVERYKARLVACGNEQKFGESFFCTFAPVMGMATTRLIMAIAKLFCVPPRHGDVPNAYVKAKCEKDLDIYMQVPKGMTLNEQELANGGENAVLKLLMSLYGLKQAGRLWNELLHSTLLKFRFEQCKTDMCLYFKKLKKDLVVVGIYVDDLLVTATKPHLVDEFFQDMKILQIKDLGIVNKFLGIRIAWNEEGYTFDQENMICDLIKKFGMENSKCIATPIAENTEILDDENELLSMEATKDFRSIAGGLLWIARCTRPDISFAVHKMTRCTHAPRVCDWKLGKRVLRYLNGTSTLKLHMKNSTNTNIFEFVAYSDADFAANKDDRKSISAVLIYLNGLLVNWIVSKQANVSLSTMESEFVAAARTVQELLGCMELLQELKIEIKLPATLYMDNMAAISQIESEASSSKSKHVDIKHKFIKDLFKKGTLKPVHMEKTKMIADLLTRNLRNMIGLYDANELAR